MAHELAGALQQVSRIRQGCAVKEPHVYVRTEYIDVAKGASPKHATGHPSCKSSRTSSPHFRITSNHRCATAPNSPLCSFIHISMAGSRSTAPLNRSNSVLIVTLLFWRSYGSVASGSSAAVAGRATSWVATLLMVMGASLSEAGGGGYARPRTGRWGGSRHRRAVVCFST